MKWKKDNNYGLKLNNFCEDIYCNEIRICKGALTGIFFCLQVDRPIIRVGRGVGFNWQCTVIIAHSKRDVCLLRIGPFSLFTRQGGHMDSLDHCFCMFQVGTTSESESLETTQASPESDKTGSYTDTCPGGRGGSAVRRVDLIVTPPKQFTFALLGWTGSKVT